MPYYKICPYCHAYLDSGERCDCGEKEKAALDAVNIQSSKVENGLPTNISTSIITE